MANRLSTCAVCRGTIRLYEGTGWWHVAGTNHGHRAEPDDSAVSGPDLKDCCDAYEDDDCDPDCDCDDCENERALDEDADRWADQS